MWPRAEVCDPPSGACVCDVATCGAGLTLPGVPAVNTGQPPWLGVAADFDGDGLEDMATAAGIVRGLGNGRFGPVHSIAPFSGVMAAADMNLDGHPDLVTSANGLHVLLNDGSGELVHSATYPALYNNFPFAIADLNGDGFPDVALAEQEALALFLSQSDGSLVREEVSEAAADFPISVAAADLDRDGLQDLIVGISRDQGGFAVWKNTGGGQLVRTQELGNLRFTETIRVADFNGDGWPDVVGLDPFPGTINVLLNDGKGGLKFSRWLETPGQPLACLAVDVNSDGLDDVVVPDWGPPTNGTGTLNVFTSRGAAGFSDIVSYAAGPLRLASAFAIFSGDFNGDGHADIALPNYDDPGVVLLQSDGKGGFVAPSLQRASQVPPAQYAQSNDVAFGDLDGDGELDLVVANLSANAVSVLFNQGGGRFAPVLDYPVAGPRQVLVLDADGDGYPDVVATHYGSTFSTLRNDGTGALAPPVHQSIGENFDSLTPVDLNGDGWEDLVATHYDTNSIQTLLADGTGGFSSNQVVAVETGPITAESSDLNGDGRPDVIVANRSDNTIRVILNQGGGMLGGGASYATGQLPVAVANFDLDRDGKLDVLVANLQSDHLSAFRSVGNGSLQPLPDIALGGPSAKLTVADLDADGQTDVVASYSTVRVLLSRGPNRFATPLAFAAGRELAAIVAADLDGDGRTDLATVDSGNSAVALLFNTCGGN